MNRRMSVLCLLLFIFFGGFAQSVKINEMDSSTGKRRIETDYITLINTYPVYLYARLTAADTSCFLELRGGDVGVGSIEAGDRAILKLDDSSTVTLLSASKQGFTLDDNRKYYTHQYPISKDQLSALAARKTISIRKYAGKTFEDILIPSDNRVNLQKLSTVFLNSF